MTPFSALSAPREVVWRRVMDDLSIEHARLSPTPTGPEMSGLVIVSEQGAPLRVEYRIRCDDAWHTRTVAIEQTWHGARRALELEHDADGRWRRDGRDAQELAGCTDVDLAITPCTNALPINRLRLPVAGRAEITAAWVRFPGLDVAAARQSYERLADARYRYTSQTSGFTAIVDVDEDGLPVDYEGIWHRIADGAAPPADRPEMLTAASDLIPLRHCLATLAYRAAKAVRDAPPGFGDLRLDEPTAMTPARIVAHMGDLMEWALSMAEGRERWHNSAGDWDGRVERFFAALAAFDAYLASGAPLHAPAERLLQGPIADALTHVGQLATRRRMAGAPVRGENYFVADIAVGRVGLAQVPPVKESRVVPAEKSRGPLEA
jgi:hypothetical protein